MRAIAKTTLAIFMISAMTVPSVQAQQACPCVPIANLWVVKSCDNWNCAAANLILANGDPYTVSLSTGNPEHPWLILRRIASGTATDSNEAYQLDAFDHATEAMSHFSSLSDGVRPMMISAPDGKMIVLSLRDPGLQKHRAVGGH